MDVRISVINNYDFNRIKKVFLEILKEHFNVNYSTNVVAITKVLSWFRIEFLL